MMRDVSFENGSIDIRYPKKNTIEILTPLIRAQKEKNY